MASEVVAERDPRSTAAIRAWWDANFDRRLTLQLRARFATLLIRCEQFEAAAEDVLGWVDQEWGLDSDHGASAAGRRLNALLPSDRRVEPYS